MITWTTHASVSPGLIKPCPIWPHVALSAPAAPIKTDGVIA